MKLILVFSLIVSLGVTLKVKPETIERWENAVAPYVEKCQKESNLSADVIEKMKLSEFPDDASFKRYLNCFHQNLKIMDSEGKVNEEKIVEHLWSDVNTVKKCVADVETESDNHQKSYKIVMCLAKAASDES